MNNVWLASVFLLLVAGCSSKAVYDNVQYNNFRECNSVPSAQYEECVERSNKSYEEYERERESVLEED